MTSHAFLNGQAVKSTLSDYGITDTVTPLIPGNSPGVPAFDFSVPDTNVNPFRFIRTRGVLKEQVPIIGTVTNISQEKASKVSTYTFESDLQQLNRFMRTFRMQGDNSIFNMIEYTLFASLPEEIAFTLDASLYIQYLQAYFPDVYDNGLDSISNVLAANRLEMHTSYTIGTSPSLDIELREAFATDLYINQPISQSVSIDDTNRSAEVKIVNYDYYFANSNIVWKSDSVTQVAANEFIEQRVTMEATPQTVIQPVCVETMIPGVGSYDPPSKYVITGNDGYIVSPQFWTDNGGSISVELDPESPKDLIIKIQGCSELSRSPYRISEGEADRPALAIAGTGVVENPKEMIFFTGDHDAPTDDQSLDSVVVGTRDQANNMMNGLIHEYGMPRQTLNISIPNSKKHLRMIKRATKEWRYGSDQLLPQQIQSAGQKLGSAEGFYSPNKYYYDPILKGIVVSVVDSSIDNTPVLLGEPSRAYPSTNTQYSLAPRILPDKRKSVMRLWLMPIPAPGWYTGAIRVRRRTAGSTVKVRVGLRGYTEDFEEHLLTSVAASVTATPTLFAASRNAPADLKYFSLGLYVDTTNTVYDDLVVDAITLRSGTTALQPGDGVFDTPASDVTEVFSNLPGAMIRHNDAMFRVSEATYTSQTIDFVAQEHTTLGDLDKIWTGQSISAFDAVHGNKTFLEFAQTPLDSTP